MEDFFKNNINTFTVFGVIATILGSIITWLTLRVAKKINKQFGQNHLKTKQIDHVCELIEVLNKSSISVSFATYEKGGYGSTGNAILFNVFEIGSYDEFEPNGLNKEFEDYSILFDKNSNQIINTKQFLDHPLTPRIIVDELLSFYNRASSVVVAGRDDDHLKKFVLIGTGIWEEKVLFSKNVHGNLVQPTGEIFQTWLNLKESSKQLKSVIGKWLIENGIEENNMREDFKNFDF